MIIIIKLIMTMLVCISIIVYVYVWSMDYYNVCKNVFHRHRKQQYALAFDHKAI